MLGHYQTQESAGRAVPNLRQRVYRNGYVGKELRRIFLHNQVGVVRSEKYVFGTDHLNEPLRGPKSYLGVPSSFSLSKFASLAVQRLGGINCQLQQKCDILLRLINAHERYFLAANPQTLIGF